MEVVHASARVFFRVVVVLVACFICEFSLLLVTCFYVMLLWYMPRRVVAQRL